MTLKIHLRRAIRIYKELYQWSIQVPTSTCLFCWFCGLWRPSFPFVMSMVPPLSFMIWEKTINMNRILAQIYLWFRIVFKPLVLQSYLQEVWLDPKNLPNSYFLRVQRSTREPQFHLSADVFCCRLHSLQIWGNLLMSSCWSLHMPQRIRPLDRFFQTERGFPILKLGDGFKQFLFSSRNLGKWSNLTSIFFKGVEATN